MHKSFTISTALDWFGCNKNEIFFFNGVLFLDGKCHPSTPSPLLSWKPRGSDRTKKQNLRDQQKHSASCCISLYAGVLILSFISKLDNPETSLAFYPSSCFFFLERSMAPITVLRYDFTRQTSLRASSPIWAREASRARTRLRLLSRASHAPNFHDISQMESLHAG